MSFKKWLKVAVRSGSFDFATSYGVSQRIGNRPYASSGIYEIATTPWRNGDGKDVFFRVGTSDVTIIYNVLFKSGAKSEYWLPRELKPRVIFDIGGNIGVTTRYLGRLFPEAQIHVFEPIPSNLDLLRKNVFGSGVTVHEFGLGSENGVFDFRIALPDQTNEGGYSRFAASTDHNARVVQARIRKTEDVLRELKLDSVDLIKIDTEGAEHDILSSFPVEVLKRTSWVFGELHSEKLAAPSPYEVLEMLSPWFEIEVIKSMHAKNFFFDACNKARFSEFKSFRRRKIR